jgi:hypothetical protein
MTRKEFWEKLGGIIECNSVCHLCPANTICLQSCPCSVTLEEMYERIVRAEEEVLSN